MGDALGAAAVAVGLGDGAGALGEGEASGAADAALPTIENKAKMIANNDCMYFLRTIVGVTEQSAARPPLKPQ
ncbi:MAG TPA: hypothetical protein VKT51_06495 [Candidatus Eremiobacteraceae bacterium]|nr:hypothetical protein [Candidatus Eremiobacteraceae bacterium]